MNFPSTEKRVQILHLLCEGASIHSIICLIGVSKNTVVKCIQSCACRLRRLLVL